MISFKWKQFRKDIILMAVRWYVAYSLSYRDIEKLMAERSSKVDHSSVNRWVMEYAPQLEMEVSKKYKSMTHDSWRMDGTYLKIKSQWNYLYRAVDKFGKTIDFYLSKNLDKKSAKRFFIKAISSNGLPEKVTIDKSGANHAGLNFINLQLALLFMLGGIFHQLSIRKIKYLNNVIEQDHRSMKRITKPMMGFKTFHSAKPSLLALSCTTC